MEFPLLPAHDPYPMLLSLARHNFDFLDNARHCESQPLPEPTGCAVFATNGTPSPTAPFSTHRFILDASLRIESLTSASDFLLGHAPERIFGTSFSALIGAESQPLWRAITGYLKDGRHFHSLHAITFISSSFRLVPAYCTVARLHPTGKLLVDAVLFYDVGLSVRPPVFSREAILAHRVHAHLLSHLDTPLPKLRKLAGLFGTNEFVLKSAFRQAYGMGIYHFHKEERLQRAYAMLDEKKLPFSEIANACGFGSYPNFSKAFKKRFGHPPRDASKR